MVIWTGFCLIHRPPPQSAPCLCVIHFLVVWWKFAGSVALSRDLIKPFFWFLAPAHHWLIDITRHSRVCITVVNSRKYFLKTFPTFSLFPSVLINDLTVTSSEDSDGEQVCASEYFWERNSRRGYFENVEDGAIVFVSSCKLTDNACQKRSERKVPSLGSDLIFWWCLSILVFWWCLSILVFKRC